MPKYVTDEALSKKMVSMGCTIRGDVIKRPRAGLYCGIRSVRLTLPEGIASLPYGVRVPDVLGRDVLFRVKHESQVKVCNKCLATDHIYRQCPQFVCRKNAQQGHLILNCPLWNSPIDSSMVIDFPAEDPVPPLPVLDMDITLRFLFLSLHRWSTFPGLI